TGLLKLEEALADADLTRAAAAVASDRGTALGRPASTAGLALDELGNLDLHRVPEHRLMELQLQLIAQVGTAEHPGASAPPRTEDIAKYVAEDVAERITTEAATPAA